MVHRIWFIFILFSLCVQQRMCESEYSVQFSSGADNCDDFDNEFFDASNMVLKKIKSDDEDKPDIMCMDGSLKINKQIDSGVMINIMVHKETGSSRELMMTSSMEFCGALKDDDAPWKPMFEAMSITSCPVMEDTYKVQEMQMELGFMKDFLSHEYCNEYFIVMEFTDVERNVISCHHIGASISEV